MIKPMKNLLIVPALVVLVTVSCSRKDEKTRELTEIIDSLSRAATYQEARRFYTENTLAVVNSAVRRGRIRKDERILLFPPFTPDARWEELEKEESKNSALITIRFTGHPVENMTGYVMTIRMINEDGNWKIDLAKELNESLQSGSREGPVEYLDRLRED